MPTIVHKQIVIDCLAVKDDSQNEAQDIAQIFFSVLNLQEMRLEIELTFLCASHI